MYGKRVLTTVALLQHLKHLYFCTRFRRSVRMTERSRSIFRNLPKKQKKTIVIPSYARTISLL